jgi:hypothetical protein
MADDTAPRWHTEPVDPDRDLPPVDHHEQLPEDPPDLPPEADQ